MILGHSRMRYAVFTLSTDTCTLIQCHLNAFEYFGGYTSEILYGNIKTVILKRALRAGGHQWNPKFEDFFSHHGFIPRLCKPCCPRTKGKIENSIRYMKRDLLLGGTYSPLNDMNRQPPAALQPRPPRTTLFHFHTARPAINNRSSKRDHP